MHLVDHARGIGRPGGGLYSTGCYAYLLGAALSRRISAMRSGWRDRGRWRQSSPWSLKRVAAMLQLAPLRIPPQAPTAAGVFP